MDKNKLKQTEFLYFIKFFLKKEYPHYISKNFSHDTINKIKENNNKQNIGFFLQFATAASFAIVTLFLIKFSTIQTLEFSKKPETIINQNSKTYNVTNDKFIDKCNSNEKSNKSFKKDCK